MKRFRAAWKAYSEILKPWNKEYGVYASLIEWGIGCVCGIIGAYLWLC